MINLPSELLKLQQGNDLRPLKPFVLLYRNKWNEQTNKYVVEDTPIDVTLMVVKPNTLSMTLDVNEVAQYNANNITITLSDKNNRFVEGTPHSYFPEGYQLYGSRMVLYYGIDASNRTALFTGVIKDLPTYKPELHQVDIKLVSPLELLKDIESKEFSDKIVGESLIRDHTDSEGHPIYRTSRIGVGGFDGIYANGVKLFEGVDCEVDKTNAMGLPATVTITNSEYYSSTITADYYVWKANLTVEQIISGLVGLAGYDSESEDIRNVVWNTEIRTQQTPNDLFTLGYRKQGGLYTYAGAGNYSYGASLPPMSTAFFIDWDADNIVKSTNIFPENFVYELVIAATPALSLGLAGQTDLRIGGNDKYFLFSSNHTSSITCLYVDGETSTSFSVFTTNENRMRMKKVGNTYSFYGVADYYPDSFFTVTADIDLNVPNNIRMVNQNYTYAYPILNYQKLTDLDSGIELVNYGIALSASRANPTTWLNIYAEKSSSTAPTSVKYRTSQDGTTFSQWQTTDIMSSLGVTSREIQFTLELNNNTVPTDFLNVGVYYLGNELNLSFVNLSGKTVLEALQDFAMISGYEFGVSRNGVFFFRPRRQSTTPVYDLDLKEIVKVDSIKKELTDFFTKLTLTFAQKPLEFYANSGEHPTLIDKYGVINKEIDKPEIINYDNPELAQAIGPQLLEIYSSLHNQLQVTAKLNLALELGDIVNLKRSYPEVIEPSASEIKKYERQQTYYRACKIVGINYNFAKKQMSYTLQDVSDDNNKPPVELYEFVYTLPIRLGVK